ncbi:MAG: alpha/beta fold hydrolase [Betaproteobacteria bacterium]|nr:alpha/beta fold hydrolase [Betaproteobacteria bacterium]
MSTLHKVSPGSAGVLLIHGLTGTPNELRFVARGLKAAGFEAECVRLAGHCGTEADLLATGWKDWYASVEEAAEELRKRVKYLFVGGLSMGAVLAMQYAIENPDKVDGLGLYGTTFFYDGWNIPWIWRNRNLISLLVPFVALGLGRGKRFMETSPFGLKNERLRQAISARMLAGDSEAAGLPGNPWPSLEQFYRLSAYVQKNLHRIHAPAIAVHAREDDVASLRNVHLIERRLRGPVETLILADSYHMVTVDQEKAALVERSVDFFSRLVARKSIRAKRETPDSSLS